MVFRTNLFLMRWNLVPGAILGRIRGLAVIATFAAACASPVDTDIVLPPPPPPAAPDPLTGAAPFLVSNAVIGASASLLGAIGSAGPVAYVSLSPGTRPGGTVATIRVDRTGAVLSVVLIDGGLDPVAVEAVAGDTITLTLQRAAGGASSLRFTVPASKPPVIVRTVPPKNKRDVPLNARMTVVFSEPIDAGSLTAQNFQLRSATTTVAGQVTFANPEHTAVEFTPDADLASGTSYELVMGAGIKDRDGMPIDAPNSIPFTTLGTQVGDLAVTTMTTGVELAPSGYLISIDDGPAQPIELIGGITVRDLSPGPHTVALLSLGENCTIDGTRARTVSVSEGTTAAVHFDVSCVPSLDASLAFVRDDQIYLAFPDGAAPRRLTNTPTGVTNADPAWSPDGTRIAFSSNRSDRRDSSRADIAAYDIYVMDADGSNVVRRTSTAWYNGNPAWSPDGQTIAYASYRDDQIHVHIVNADNAAGAEVRLTTGLGFHQHPAWSPDGRTITFTNSQNGGFLWSDPSSVSIMNVDGSDTRTLVEWSSFTNGNYDLFYFQPAWSPDGRRIAMGVCKQDPWSYGRDPWSGCFSVGVGLANADGSGLTVVAYSNGYARPTWSPDGRIIAFTAQGCYEGCTSIKFVLADGSAEGLIVANAHSPAWRP